MLSSGYLAEHLITEIEAEVNSNLPVTRDVYCNIINETEQLIYSEIIKEQRISELPFAKQICVFDIPYDEYTEDVPRCTDIYSVFLSKSSTGHIELEKTTPEMFARGVQSDYSYMFDGDSIKFNIKSTAKNDKVVFIRLARPIIKRVIGNKVTGIVALPAEFTELMRCRLRTETYRLMNDEELCAKWADKYNYHLENFKSFVEARKPTV